MGDNSNSGLREHNINLRTAVLIMYCLVAAGAFGIEEMIAESGPGLTIVMLIVLPFLWAAPQAFTSAELGSAIPEAGGFYKWVQRGLGEFWGFQAGWCRTLSCYLDNTVYIVLAASYMGMLIPMTDLQQFGLKAAFILVFTYINLRGITDIGRVSTVLSICVLVTFAAVAVVGFANWNQNPLSPFIPPGETMIASVGASLSIGMWMYSGYTSMSTLSAEIKDKSVIPKGLLIILPLTAITYILPTIASLASVGRWDEWSTTGGVSFGHVLALAGNWGLGVFFVVATLSNLSIFNTQMISISRGFYAMAADNLAPKSLVKLSKKYGVPYISVLSLTVFCLIFCSFDFAIIVTIDVLLLMVDYVLVWISGARLRITEPDMPRPFKVPIGTKGFICMVSSGIGIAILALFLNGTDYFLGGMVGLITSPLMYVVFKRMYGGMSTIDPEKYPLNPRTKLTVGDLDKIAVIFGLFGFFGFIGWFFFPWYEGDWGPQYYAETYGGGEGTFEMMLFWIKVVTIVFILVAIGLKLAARKLEPTDIELKRGDFR